MGCCDHLGDRHAPGRPKCTLRHVGNSIFQGRTVPMFKIRSQQIRRTCGLILKRCKIFHSEFACTPKEIYMYTAELMDILFHTESLTHCLV